LASKDKQQTGKRSRDNNRNSGTGWLAFATVIDTLVERFGWPGVLVIFVMYMILYHATDEQRHAMIDMYVLGRGIGNIYPNIIMGGLFVCVVFGQRYAFQKKIRLMEKELARIGSEKSTRQEEAMGTRLHHAPADKR
jgi:hypothetical protein